MKSTSNRLVSRNSVAISQVFDDPMCAIIFELEYVVSIPVQVNIFSSKNSKKNVITDTKKQNEILVYNKSPVGPVWGAMRTVLQALWIAG